MDTLSSHRRLRRHKSFSQEGCPGDRLTLQPHQQAQARLSTGAGGLGFTVDGNEENVRFDGEQGWGLAGCSGGRYRSFWASE